MGQFVYRAWKQLEECSLLLIIGAVCALAWANLRPVSYHALMEFRSGRMVLSETSRARPLEPLCGSPPFIFSSTIF